METQTLVQPAPTQRAPLDIKLMVPFINSIRTVFKTMLNIEPVIQRPSIKPEPIPRYEVSGIIGFSGDVIGSVIVSFQKATAVKLIEAFAGTQMDPTSADFADAVGELTNMVAGGAKKDLGNAASISCPNVIIGTGHVIARLRDVPCLMIPCETPCGPFAVEVSIKRG